MLLPYSGPTSRRARVVGRYLKYAVHRDLLPRATYVPTYWWDQQRNFGDQLTPTLLPTLGVAPIHQLPRHAALVGVGSIIEHLPADYRGVVWGTGLMFDHTVRLPNATFAAVRGLLTAERLGLGHVATGDPGLLLRDRGGVPHGQRSAVLVPHFRHRSDPLWDRLQAYLGPRTRRVDVRGRPTAVAGQIASASMVVTSSLHGLITADANGVPAAWTLPRPWGEGGAFKFLDYESNFGRTWERQVSTSATLRAFGDAVSLADQSTVRLLREGLVQALSRLATGPEWKEYNSRPLVAMKIQRRRTSFGSRGNQWPSGDSIAVIPPRGG